MSTNTRKVTDIYGRSWDLSSDELCPECGQPDNCGDCNHAPLSDRDYALLNGWVIAI